MNPDVQDVRNLNVNEVHNFNGEEDYDSLDYLKKPTGIADGIAEDIFSNITSVLENLFSECSQPSLCESATNLITPIQNAIFNGIETIPEDIEFTYDTFSSENFSSFDSMRPVKPYSILLEVTCVLMAAYEA